MSAPDSFGAVPRRLLRALHLREIDYDDFAILCYLTLAEDHRTGEWIGQAARMAEELGWPHTLGHLVKTLKSLADRGWIESGAVSGSRKPYPIRLLPKARREPSSAGARPELGQESPPAAELSSAGLRLEDTANTLHDGASGSSELSRGRVPKKETAAVEEDQDLRPRPSRARSSADAPVEDQDLDLGERSAAAVEPASESEIREAVGSLRGADRGSLNVVEPLARLVASETFFELVERARAADNPVGWLVARLRDVIREGRLDEQNAVTVAAHEPEPIERLSPEEALDASVRQFAANGHSWEVVAEHVSAVFGAEHVDTARAIFAGVSALRSCAFERATVGRVPSAADVALRADVRDVRDEQDRERAGVVPARFEAAPVAGGCVGETVDRCEKTIAAGHSRNAMTRWGRRNAS